MNYSISERIFTYTGPGTLRRIAVFSVSDLTEVECEVLKSSVQRSLDILNRSAGHGPFVFELGPSAATDLPSFIVLKTDLVENQRELEANRGQPSDTWRWELGLIHDIAKGLAETIRSLRSHANSTEGTSKVDGSDQARPPATNDPLSGTKSTPSRFQVEDEDAGGRLVMFDTEGAQEWGPRIEHSGNLDWEGVFEWTYGDFLYRLPTGRFVRIRHSSHCEANLPFNPSLKRFSDEQAAEWLLFGGFQLPSDIAPLAEKHLFTEVPPPLPPSPDPSEFDSCWIESEPSAPAPKTAVDACEELRRTYRDPDNYWRNVWLYEQRKAGKTNRELLSELERIASERGFAPLASDGGLRRALETIAQHHGWPVLEGKSGRPRAKSSPNGSGDCGGDNDS